MSDKVLLLCAAILVTYSHYVTASAGQQSANNSQSTGSPDMKKMRQMEAELEMLRRAVTDLRSDGACGTQNFHLKAFEDLMEDVRGLRAQLQSLQVKQELSALRSDLLRMKSTLTSVEGNRALNFDYLPLEGDHVRSDADRTLQPASVGAVYERWGNSGCPNDTELVFSGVIGGSLFDHPGGDAEALCLPLNPVLENNPGVNLVAYIHGAELEMSPLPKHDHDPLCAVCRTPRATVLMVPAANACHSGWTMEYSGYLMAGHPTLNKASSEFICVDKQQHTRVGSSMNDNGKVFHYATAVCGSLPCPPYENGKVFPCVVCSK